MSDAHGSQQAKGESLATEGKFLGGGLGVYERAGRLQLEVLVHEGLKPSSTVLDLGCGSLRGGYWIMHFLDPGRYFGIEPHEDRVKTGLKEVLEPDFAQWAQPTFSHNADFDLGVFGQKFDFVLGRSVLTHTSKSEIEALLASFVEWGNPGAVMLVSYHRASAWRRPVHDGSVAKPHGLAWRVFHKLFKRPPRVGDYRGDTWQAGNVSHSFAWIKSACGRHGLAVRELDYGIVASQIWLRIEHP